MAWLEQDSASKRYCLRYRWEGKKLKSYLKTSDHGEAEAILKIVQATLVRLERGWLELPAGADLVTFALTNGKSKAKTKTTKETHTLRQILDGYCDGLPAGAIEPTTLVTIKIHQKHFREVLGDVFPIRQLTSSHLQDYINSRSRRVTRGESPISPVTIKKELTTVSLELMKHSQYVAAESYLREYIAIREKKLPDDWTTFNTNSLLGTSLLGQKNYADAEPLLLAGYDGMKEREASIPREGKQRLTEALERLVQLYDAWGMKEKADEWRAKLQSDTDKSESIDAKQHE